MDHYVTLLIVEDDRAQRLLLGSLFESSGFSSIFFARNGIEAIETFTKIRNKPLIIIMDYKMPEMDGLEALEKILEIDREVCVVILSADEQINERAIVCGAKAFIKKPFTSIKDIVTVITSLL